MFSTRSWWQAAATLALIAACGGGGGGDPGGGVTVCLNCSGLSGNSLLQCRIRNSSIPGCDEPSPVGPPNVLDAFGLVNPPVTAYASSGAGFEAIVPAGTDVRALVATFRVAGPPGAAVAVGDTQQISGVTPNDFTQPVGYTVIPASGATSRHTVSVTAAPAANIWTWVGGALLPSQAGIYGTRGVAAPANMPGERRDAVSWVDAAGTFWLFGGWGLDVAGASWRLNDLWKFDGAQWTWVGGGNTINQPGTYGTRNTAAPANMPGAREGATSWKDARGDLWLFGGYGVDAAGVFGYLNDLWKFDRTNWTWVSGSTAGNAAGDYGTKGTAAPTNVPEGRSSAVSWRDAAGNFWIFGGTGARGELSDLWKFDGTQWTWVSGSSSPSQSGVYGTKGAAADTNAPGARQKAVTWLDTNGQLLLFGGTGRAAAGRHGLLNDLWRFDGTRWTWLAGSDLPDAPSTGTSNGTSAPTNTPGGRSGAVGWTDAAGRHWLFGGFGADAFGASGKQLNELWRHDGSGWASIRPAGTAGTGSPYGAKGLPIVYAPFGRAGGVSWLDATGRLWVFGGNGYTDLMRYQP